MRLGKNQKAIIDAMMERRVHSAVGNVHWLYIARGVTDAGMDYWAFKNAMISLERRGIIHQSVPGAHRSSSKYKIPLVAIAKLKAAGYIS